MSQSILVVDDEADVQEITKLGLEMKTDWTVLIAGSGEEALQMAREQQPSAILLDMMMPDMDGRATLRALKASSLTAEIPVILVTAKAQPATLEEFADLAVAAIIAKPFRPLQLAAEIAQALGWADA
ncbi:MAG: response regulator [Cyanobacteria bacterium J06648_16]